MKGVFFFIILLSLTRLQAQDIKSDTPFSFLYPSKVQTLQHPLKALDLASIYIEDSIQYAEHQQFNVARLIKINPDFISDLKALRTDTNKEIWKTEFSIPKTKALALKIKHLHLPKGSQLFLYTPNQLKDFLVFDASQQAIDLNHFISKKIQGSRLILEYNQTIKSLHHTKDSLILDIEGLVDFYIRKSEGNPGFGQSTECEVNVACSEGDGWCNEAQSVVRIFIQSGASYSYCSGTLVNNTRQDFAPYILTAEHCGAYSNEEDFKYWKFDFNYQSDACQSPASEIDIPAQAIYGCQTLAKAKRNATSGSDFRLLRLLDSVPKSWNIYYAGWDVHDYTSIKNGGVGIHHPYGDIKKISTFLADLQSSDAYGGHENDDFWKTYWTATENGHGITEGGSSGSPLFNDKGLIIGTLSTGSSYCDNRKTSPDYYAKMARHWTSNGSDSTQQLKVWLDPLNSGVLQLGGKARNTDLECGTKINFNDFTLFPNPAKTIIQVGNSDLSVLANAIFEIYNVNGTLVKTLETNSNIEVKQIDIHSLSDGIYVLKVIQDHWLIQKKFVILR